MAFAQFARLTNTQALRELYSSRHAADLEAYSRGLLEGLGVTDDDLLNGFTVSSAPSLDWTPRFPDVADDEVAPATLLDSLILGYRFEKLALLEEFRALILKAPVTAPGEPGFRSVGADPGGALADHWRPRGGAGAVFGHAGDAHRQIRAKALQVDGLTGGGVHVVIVDQGLSSAHLGPAYGGGLDYKAVLAPGSGDRTSHAMMMARSILDLAPDARLYDVPIVPDRIRDVNAAASDFAAVYELLVPLVTVLRHFPKYAGSWIIVNAWAIFDRTSEDPLGDYTQDSHPAGHDLNTVVTKATETMDVVFAAGNAGQYLPDRRCGPIDRGPGHSIWGANAHRGVVTVGGVRADDVWVGNASQGPVVELGAGPHLLEAHKPDLAAPTFFRDDRDAARHYTGTSAACAVTAGVMASLRSHPAWGQDAVSSATLRQALIESARRTLGPGWNRRTGHGILDAARAMAILNATMAKRSTKRPAA